MPTLVDATRYSFSPHFDESSRVARTICFLLPKLSAQLPLFPNEVLLMVARLLVRECAAVTRQEETLAYGGISRLLTIDRTRNIYAKYCRIDGVRYVQILRNTKPARGEWQLLYDTRRGAASGISLVEDHLGIRVMRFIFPDSPPPPALHIRRAWWRDVRLIAGSSPHLQATTDARTPCLIHLPRKLN